MMVTVGGGVTGSGGGVALQTSLVVSTEVITDPGRITVSVEPGPVIVSVMTEPGTVTVPPGAVSVKDWTTVTVAGGVTGSGGGVALHLSVSVVMLVMTVPGSVTVDSEPGRVTVVSEPGKVTVDVKPGPESVNVETEPGPVTVTVSGGVTGSGGGVALPGTLTVSVMTTVDPERVTTVPGRVTTEVRPGRVKVDTDVSVVIPDTVMVEALQVGEPQPPPLSVLDVDAVTPPATLVELEL